MSLPVINVNLGCFGRIDENFVSCPSCKNTILIVDEKFREYDRLMDYFEANRLFDKKMFDYNAIRNFIYKVKQNFDDVTKPIWTPKQYSLYEKFVVEHRFCGLYLELSLTQAVTEIPEIAIPIKAKDSKVNEGVAPKISLKVVKKLIEKTAKK